jgi:hypothetical protein
MAARAGAGAKKNGVKKVQRGVSPVSLNIGL